MPSYRPDHWRLQIYTQGDLDRIEGLERLSDEQRFEIRVIASVLPFRVNNYVTEMLIDWDRIPRDPIYQLIFPQRDMLAPDAFDRIARLLKQGASASRLQVEVGKIRAALNPQPAGQLELNVPYNRAGVRLNGLQHKYRESVLFFPTQGQTCHSYCSFCFRWAQFIGDTSLRMASADAAMLHDYLRDHTEVTDLLLTGGDPMVMKAKHLATFLDPLLAPELEHVYSIRIGSKALSFWPYRFISDPDADLLINLFEKLIAAGKRLVFMAHFNHWRELETDVARQAIQRLHNVGVEIRSQGPVLAHINDDPNTWARLWNQQTRLGIIPYYMFVERNTGANRYFELPLVRAWEIYRDAIKQVSGLARTARGPSMSTGPGKVEIQGVAEIKGEKVFVLRFIQGRDPDWVQRPFFARFDPQATWLDQLQPAFGEQRFFFE